MKRYLIFSAWPYEESGGWGDFVGDFDSTHEAAAAVSDKVGQWAEIVDSETKQVILNWTVTKPEPI